MATTNPTLFPLPASHFNPPQMRARRLRDQPAFRVSQNAAACSVPELFATLIGGEKQIETADALLAHFGGDLRRIYQAHPTELSQVKGVTINMAARIKAALTLGIRLNDPIEERVSITSPSDAAALVQYEMGLLQQEYLKVMLLDTRNHVMDVVEVYHGSVNSSQVRIAEVMRPAVQRMATSMIVLHNHPSRAPRSM